MRHTLRTVRTVVPFVALALAACGSGSTGSDAGDGSLPDTITDDATSTVDTGIDAGSTDDVATTDVPASTDSGFTPGPHAPLVQVPDQGGRRLSHPQLVTVTFPGYTLRTQVEAFGDWIVGSDWLQTVGEQYGIGTGTHVARVAVTEAAPTTIDDNAIQLWIRERIADGTLPTPPVPDANDYLYTIYYPRGTTVTEGGGTSCQAFGGYHSSIGVGSLNVSYAVIPDCPGFDPSLDELGGITVTTSHELIEAATDADPIGGAAWALTYTGTGMDASPWILVGGEVGDLCLGQYIRDNGYSLQRTWSNMLAAQDQDPCMPGIGRPYYSVSAEPDTVMFATAGQTLRIPLHGWSSAPVSAWMLYAVPVSGTFTPTVQLSTSDITNGGTVTLTVQIPAGTPSQSYSAIYVESYDATMHVNTYPVAVFVQ